jgi:hypothetical protein
LPGGLDAQEQSVVALQFVIAVHPTNLPNVSPAGQPFTTTAPGAAERSPARSGRPTVNPPIANYSKTLKTPSTLKAHFLSPFQITH